MKWGATRREIEGGVRLGGHMRMGGRGGACHLLYERGKVGEHALHHLDGGGVCVRHCYRVVGHQVVHGVNHGPSLGELFLTAVSLAEEIRPVDKLCHVLGLLL